MNQISKLTEWIKQLPEWGKTLSFLATTILALVGVYRVYQENFPAFILVVVPFMIFVIMAVSVYLIFARGTPSFIGGRGLHLFSIVTRIIAGIIVFAIGASSARYYLSDRGRVDVKQALHGTFTPTPTNTPLPTSTPTETLIPTSTFTATLSPTPTPKEQGIYYMIVLDASLSMLESFETESKWDAALRAVTAILETREKEANYGLVVIGGSGSQEGGNPCGQPSTVAIPFSSRDIVVDHINQLQPSGGGSIFTAFNLAKDQFRTLPEDTVRTLVFITGSSDACESREEWVDLERAFNFPGGIGLEMYSEIIVLEQNAVISRTIEEQFDSLSTNLNVQAPQTIFQLVQTNNTVINNVSNYVDITISSFPTAINPAFTPIPTSTPIVGVTNQAPPTPIPPTQIPPTPIPPTPTPQPTSIPAPLVLLTGFNYVGTGEGCQALVSFEVYNTPATGYFRIWNQWYTDNNLPYDSGYPLVTLPVGPNGYQVGLGGNGNPAYYRHKVWFEYNGTESNELDLICPGLTPVP